MLALQEARLPSDFLDLEQGASAVAKHVFHSPTNSIISMSPLRMHLFNRIRMTLPHKVRNFKRLCINPRKVKSGSASLQASVCRYNFTKTTSLVATLIFKEHRIMASILSLRRVFRWLELEPRILDHLSPLFPTRTIKAARVRLNVICCERGFTLIAWPENHLFIHRNRKIPELWMIFRLSNLQILSVNLC